MTDFNQNVMALTQRERQILSLVCRGLTNVEISKSLGIRPATAKTHLQNIYRKLSVHNRTELLVKMLHKQVSLQSILKLPRA